MENFFSNDELINLEHEAVLEIEEKSYSTKSPVYGFLHFSALSNCDAC